ncbi:MAG: hypothetical protein JWQ39_2491 [Glaciihabitans sp.]|nr:hypothetical protein [Glaciihabitans sp.]
MQVGRVAWQGVVGFPVRTVLTCLGLVVGIVGIVSVYSASGTVEATVTQRAMLAGGPVTTIDISGLTGATALDEAHHVEGELLQTFARPGNATITAALPSVRVTIGSQFHDVDVVFAEPSLRAIRPFPLVSGNWISDKPGYLLPHVVVNQPMAQQLNAGVGSDISLGTSASDSMPAVVSGVVLDGGVAPSMYVSINDVREFLVENGSQLSASIELSSPGADVQTVERRLSQLSSLSNESTTWDVKRRDTIQQLASEILATRSSFLAVGLLGLLASIFAISNVGLSSVRERAIELSIRRAVGARRRQIPLIMIIESQIIAVFAGAIAIPLSSLFYSLIGSTFSAPYGVSSPPYPWIYALVGVAIGMATALVGSLAPTVRANSVQIATVMRE